ncbi:MAG: Snf7 family protein [Thermoproteota archaeon]
MWITLVRLFRRGGISPPPEPIRSEDTSATNEERILVQLEVQVEKLRRISQRMTSRGRELFEICIRAQQQGDNATASMYAGEVAQLRKIASVVMKGELSLEKVALRLRSIRDFRQAIGAVGPAIKVIQQIGSELKDIAPEISTSLIDLDERLDDLIISSGSVPIGFNERTVLDQEAQKILQEASAVAEQRIRSNFPEMQQSYSSWETGRRT